MSKTIHLLIISAVFALFAACSDSMSLAPEGPGRDFPDRGDGPNSPYMTLSPDSASLIIGETLQIQVIADHDIGPITWTSQDPDIATVSEDGVVTAVDEGRAVITAKNKGQERAAVVRVGKGKKDEEPAPDPEPEPEPEPAPPPPAPQGQWRWPTARTMVTDFYYNWTPALRDTVARRFDYVMSGSLDEWKSRNPDVRHLPYQTHWAIGRSDTLNQTGPQAHFENWYAQNCPGRSVEEAYLHNAGTSKTYANRLRFHIWSTHRFAFNPGDPCWRQYQQRRVGQALAAGSVGVFYDEYGVGIMTPVRRATLEYSSATAYDAALVSALKAERAAYPTATLMLNTAEYLSAEDRAMILAAGATHLELFNDLSHGDMRFRWSWAEGLVAEGMLVQMVGRKNWRSTLHSSMTPGNYRDATLDGFVAPGMYRQKMGELASYYLVQDAAQVRLLIDTNNDNWSVSPTAHWLRAQEIDVGQPVGSRREIMSGTDPQGQGVSVWQREFSRAWILARPSVGWDNCCYGDAGAVTVQLPSPGRLLHHDGTLGPTVTQIKLRKAEGAILIKQ